MASALGVGYHYQGLDGVLVGVGHSLVVPGWSELCGLLQLRGPLLLQNGLDSADEFCSYILRQNRRKHDG